MWEYHSGQCTRSARAEAGIGHPKSGAANEVHVAVICSRRTDYETKIIHK